MRHAIHSSGDPNQKGRLFRFPVLVRAGIAQASKECEVYWIDKNVEPTPFDSEYLARLKARDPRAQEHFAGHFNRLLAIKLRSHGIYGSQMDDLRQDALIRALQRIYEGRIDSPESLPAFVYGVCGNVIKEFIRGEIAARVRDTNEFPDLPDSRYRADDSVHHREVARSVTFVLRSLPEKDRDILKAVFIAENDKDAICREHGITRDYLRVLLHRSLINARKVLDKQSTDNGE